MLWTWARLLSRSPLAEVRVYHLDRGRRRSQNSPQAAPSVLSHHEHATSSWANSQFLFVFSCKTSLLGILGFFVEKVSFIDAEIIFLDVDAYYLFIRPTTYKMILYMFLSFFFLFF